MSTFLVGFVDVDCRSAPTPNRLNLTNPLPHHHPQLLLRSGMMSQSAAGLYHLLPMGLRVLHKLQYLLRQRLAAVGAQECVLSSLTPKELWQASGRWDAAGPELLRVTDRRGAEYCLAPTHEEAITALLGSQLMSYRALPQMLYQMERKYRDEVRPRFGLIRAREFWMKDLYTFDVDEAAARATYEKIRGLYSRLLQDLGLPFACVQADPKAMGGYLSHEFQILAPLGEDSLLFCDHCGQAANVEMMEGAFLRKEMAMGDGQGD